MAFSKTSGSVRGIVAVLQRIVVGGLLTASAGAMPPHPDVALHAVAQAGMEADHLLADARSRGLDQPDDYFRVFIDRSSHSDVQSSPASNAFRVLALLVDFPDNTSSTQSRFFDSLVFSTEGTSVHSYFDEISYGQIDLVTVNLPSTVGWNRLSTDYAYYVNGQRGIGDYPRNSQKLVEDLVKLVDPAVDFSRYDNDGDGVLDVLLVIHAGTGYERSGDVNDIHSHKWSLPYPGMVRDGVTIYSYTIQPEYWYTSGDMTIGVYAHELSHGFELPDLYDTDYSSNGIGYWGVMGFGAWNGPNGLGGSPAHPCAWSRIQMGITSPTQVQSNVTGQVISAVQSGGPIYRLPVPGASASEYFLVENRRQVGYDTYLPSGGLLIWHIDEAKSGNSAEWYPGKAASAHYLVALEQADGQFDLEHSNLYGNKGDAGDPYPGSTGNTAFTTSTVPSSDGYTSGTTITAVTDISAPGDQMSANFVVGTSASVGDGSDGDLPSVFTLRQNYPNPFNPSTAIEFDLLKAANVKLTVYNQLGRKVKTLIDGFRESGPTSVLWDGSDDQSNPVASGIYIYQIKVNKEKNSKKMVLVR
jgi:immune inhibitor A